MSRTYRKVLRLHNCVGSNTSYYREKRRGYRTKLRNNLSKAMKFEDPDDYFAHPETEQPFVDRWLEPTDGHWLYIPEETTDRAIEYELNKAPYPWDEEWYNFVHNRWLVHLKSTRKNWNAIGSRKSRKRIVATPEE